VLRLELTQNHHFNTAQIRFYKLQYQICTVLKWKFCVSRSTTFRLGAADIFRENFRDKL